MLKYINFKFILTATLTFIPYTVLWFFWHNNLFSGIYYSLSIVYSINGQNIWLMNFANALLVYGFVYFYFNSVKSGTGMLQAVLWGVYYNLSVIGFFSFMLAGFLKDWNFTVLLYDLIWAFAGGAFSGILLYTLFNKIVRQK